MVSEELTSDSKSYTIDIDKILDIAEDMDSHFASEEDEKLEALESIESKGFFGRIWSKFVLWIMSLFGFGDNESS